MTTTTGTLNTEILLFNYFHFIHLASFYEEELWLMY